MPVIKLNSAFLDTLASISPNTQAIYYLKVFFKKLLTYQCKPEHYPNNNIAVLKKKKKTEYVTQSYPQ